MNATLALDLLVGAVLLGSGGVCWLRRRESRIGLLLTLTGVAWFAGYVDPALTLLHRGPLTHALLSYPTGRVRGRFAGLTVALGYAAALAEAFAATPWLQLGLALLLAACAWRLFWTAGGAARSASRPALGAAWAFAGVLALGAANQLLGWQLDQAILLTYEVTILLIAMVLTVDLLRGRWTDAALADLVSTVRPSPASGLQAELRRALGDPSLEVGYWTAHRSAYLTEAGDVLQEPGSGRAVAAVDDEGPVARIVLDRALLGDPALVEGALAVVRLTARNARVLAATEAGITELRASRRRIVEAADDQHRRFAALLEAGPYRDLSRAAELLGGLTDGDRTHLLAELAGIRADLDALAHGVHPSALAEGGLAAAITSLAARSAVPASVIVDVPRLPSASELVLYLCCAEALTNTARHAVATVARIRLTSDGRTVTLEVQDDGVGGADSTGAGLRGLADRVEALGGTLAVDSPPEGGGTRLTVELPDVAGEPP